MIPECTNISVGYYNAHGNTETQDIAFLDQLLDALLYLEEGNLIISRDPKVVDLDDYRGYGYANGYGSFRDYDNGRLHAGMGEPVNELASVVKRYPEVVASFLESYNIQPEDIYQYMGLMRKEEEDDQQHSYGG